MKLSFYYQVTATGAGSKEVIINNGNSTKWHSVVDDERTLWTKYAVNSECLAFTHVKDGMVISIVKIFGGSRLDNNVATWIFVPANLIISGAELLSVIDEIRQLYTLGTKSVTEDNFTKNHTLDKDYKTKQISPAIHVPAGDKLAYRTTVGDWSINEILDRPFQRYYSDYKFVFLFNQLPTDVDGIEDLSNKEIEDLVTVLAPSKKSIKDLFGDAQITIMIGNRKFTDHITRKKGEILHFTADRPGFIPREFNGQVEDDEQEAKYSLKDKETGWLKIISTQDFVVKDSATNKQIHGSKIEILNPEWNNKNKTLPEKILKSVKLRVEANGYVTKEDTFDLSNGYPVITIEPREETKNYKYRTTDGRTLKITITGVGINSTSPLEGYSLVGNELFYNAPNHEPDSQGPGKGDKSSLCDYLKSAWKRFVYGIIATILFAILAWGCYEIYNWLEPIENNNGTPATQNNDNPGSDTHKTDTAAQPDSNQVSTLATNYLDNNAAWHKDSLEKHQELIGLFDELNNYNFSNLLEREDQLKTSEKFKELLKVVKQHTNCNPKGPYNTKANDIVITFDKYIKKINEHQGCVNTQGKNSITEKNGANSQTKALDVNKNNSQSDVNK